MRGNDLAGMADDRRTGRGHAGTGLPGRVSTHGKDEVMGVSASAPTRTNRTLSAWLLSAGLILGATVTADAQGFGRTFFDDDILPPRVVAWRLADRGFTNLSRPRFDGRVYVVDAVGPAGMPVRLILDPATGEIIGRQRPAGADVYARLDPPPARAMPGYGYTEEDVAPRPLPSEAPPTARAPRRAPTREAVRPPDANTLGLNPDAAPRAEPPRKVARTSPEKSLSRVSPLAPAAKSSPAAPPAPAPSATVSPAPDAPPAATKETPAPEAKPVAQAPSKPDWKDPPAEGKRPVRVIGGATVVPGTAGKDGEAAQPQP
jgi:hypothetical protein